MFWRGIRILTLSDIAKYPFLPEAAEEVRRLEFKIEHILEPDYESILSRAERRIIEALTTSPPEVKYDPLKYRDDVEILSFPVAVVLVSALANEYVKRRFALAEARRAYNLLRAEDEEKIIEVAKRFGWRIKASNEKVGHERFNFSIHFTDYLRNASSFHEKEWKLVNRPLAKGEVYLFKQEVARLLQEEIKRYIEAKIDPKIRLMLPEKLLERVEMLKGQYAERIKDTGFTEEDLSSSGVESNAFPPCIKELYEAAQSGRHIPHVGRFALTSFLLRIGMDPNVVVDLFRKFADFNERMTRYQIEHIAGQRGSGTRYLPPKCDTLQTHGLCPGVDDLCRKVKHPLTYYRRKMRSLSVKKAGGA